MDDVTKLPIGAEIIEDHADISRMTHLCRCGFTPIQHLPGNRVVMRRDFHKLLTQYELLAQLRILGPLISI
jgi:hypothetical protein